MSNDQGGYREGSQMTYCKVASTSPSHLEAHAGYFRLSMKEEFDVYLL